MRNRKRCWNHLNLYDYQGIERHLSAMAAKGWRLEKAGPQLWTYRRAEPASVHYAVTYIPDSSQFNPGPTESQQTLEELCTAAGWEKVCDWYQMQIYVSEAAKPVPLETDEALRLEVIHRSMRKNFLPGNAVLLLFSLLMAVLWGKTMVTDPLRLFRSNAHLFTGPLWILASALEIVNLGSYWLWRRRSAASVAEGGRCALTGKVSRWANRVAMACIVLYVAAYLAVELTNPHILPFLATYSAALFLLGFLMRQTTAFLRRRGTSRKKNMAVTFTMDVILSFALVGGMIFCAIHFDWFGTRSGETYRFDHFDWDVSPIEIPLEISELTGQTYQHISRTHFEERSLFLTRHSYRERVLEGEDHLSVSYEITESGNEWLYGKAVAEYTKEEIATSWDITWRAVDPAPWGAETAYQRYMDGNAKAHYVLCYAGRIVEFSLFFRDEAFTETQMRVVGKELGR